MPAHSPGIMTYGLHKTLTLYRSVYKHSAHFIQYVYVTEQTGMSCILHIFQVEMVGLVDLGKPELI